MFLALTLFSSRTRQTNFNPVRNMEQFIPAVPPRMSTTVDPPLKAMAAATYGFVYHPSAVGSTAATVTPLKPPQAAVWGFVSHPSTASTATGPPTLSEASILRRASASFTRSSDGAESYTPGSRRSNTPTIARPHYVAVLPGVIPSISGPRGIPPNSVSMSDMSPAWAQYQTTSTGGLSTPVYCSLTPTKATFQPLTAQEGGAGGQSRQPSCLTMPAHKDNPESSGSCSIPSTNENTSSQSDGLAGDRRRSSLLLNETPLQIHSLPEEVQASIQAARTPQEPFKHLPDWFDAELGCIRRECLPELPSFRTTLNTFEAKLSVESRVHQRTRCPGEPAKAMSRACQQNRDKGVRRVSCPDAALLRRRSDTISGLSGSAANSRAASGSIEQGRNSVLSEATEGLAARSRRVRFATVAAAREYKERSPSPPAGSPSYSELPFCAAPLPQSPREVTEATDLTQTLLCQKAAEAFATAILHRMTEMIQRLLRSPALQKDGHSTEGLQISLELLRAFETECVGHLPALSFFADTLETCEQLVEQKLPEEERKQLLELIEVTKTPLLSREAVMRLHRIRQELRHPKDLELLVTPLETLQRLRVCDRRKAISGLSLCAATADEPLLETDQKMVPNVFLVKDSACGVVSSRPWNGAKNQRAFAVDVLRRCEHDIEAMKQCSTEDQSFASPGKVPQTKSSGTLAGLVEAALQKTEEFGMCSMGIMSLDTAGERLRFATCGFLRLLVLRRSPASGILCRVTEAPVRNAAAAADTQLFRWPSRKELLDEFRHNRQTDGKGGATESKGRMDPGLRRQALLRVVEWGDNDDGRSSRGLVEQEMAVQEGDMFVIADDILFDVISSEEIRHLFSCCLTSVETKDLTDISLCSSCSCLPALLKRLWRQRVPNLKALLARLEQRRQRLASQALAKRAMSEILETCPLDLSIVAGWIHKKPTDGTSAGCQDPKFFHRKAPLPGDYNAGAQ